MTPELRVYHGKGTCDWCHKPFVFTYTKRKPLYCRDECRTMGHRHKTRRAKEMRKARLERKARHAKKTEAKECKPSTPEKSGLSSSPSESG